MRGTFVTQLADMMRQQLSIGLQHPRARLRTTRCGFAPLGVVKMDIGGELGK